MLEFWKSMWSDAGDHGEPEQWTPWVMAAIAVASIIYGAWTSFGPSLDSFQHAAAPVETTTVR